VARKTASVRVALLTLVCVMDLSPCALADSPHEIDIPAGQLTVALQALAEQSGIQFVYSAEDLQGVCTRGAHGSFTMRTAVAKLLEGTDLAVTAHDSGAFLIAPAAARSAGRPPVARESHQEGIQPAVVARAEAAAAPSVERPYGETPAPDSGSAAAASADVGQIIVTAVKLPVDVMHAAISMTAINGDTLRRSRIQRLSDLQFYVPGLSISNQVQTANINIRGIGSTFSSPNIAQGVPVYRDGLLIPTSVADEPLWDVANVQVLRGPQGTLVGANSTGGAMFINTVDPMVGGGIQGYAQATGGNYHHVQLQSAVDLPIGAAFAARVGMYYDRRGSYSRNLTASGLQPAAGVPALASRLEPGDEDMAALRGALLWRPSERVSVLAKIDYFRNDTGYPAEKPIPIHSTEVNGVTTVCPVPGSYFGAEAATWSSVPAACGAAPFAPASPYDVAYAAPDTSLREQIWRGGLHGHIQLGAGGPTLRLLAGGAFNSTRTQAENTASPYFSGGSNSTTQEHTWTLEADLLSRSGAPLQWVVGGFWWANPTDFTYAPVNFSGGPFGVGTGFSAPTGGLLLDGSNSRRSHALFGDASYRLRPRWKVEMGLRETWDENSNPYEACPGGIPSTPTCYAGDANAFHFLSPNPADPWGALVFNGSGLQNLGLEKDSFLTWKLAIDYRIGASDFLYAEAATGAKSGGIRTNAIGDNFAPEKDTDYELGWKSTLLDGRADLQLDGFYTSYRHMQIRATDVSSGQGSIFNAGSARDYGVEFAGRLRASGWQVAATASYTKSSVTIGDIVNGDVCGLYVPCTAGHPVQCPPGVPNGPYDGNACFNFRNGGLYLDGRLYPWLEDVNGIQLPNSPNFQGNVSLAYDWLLPDGDLLIPRIDFSYEGRQYGQIYDTPLDDLPARKNLDFMLAYVHDRWTVEGFVANLTAAVYPIAEGDPNVNDAEIFNSPRRFGARVMRSW
jgi:iron complex outermembrane recepter protein